MGNLAIWLERRVMAHRSQQTAATRNALASIASNISKDMKAKHPWTNRTTDAEKSLGVISEFDQKGNEGTFTLRVGYVNPPQVSYGIWLELAHAGVWAIVRPTVQRYRSIVQKNVAQARRV
jgi:hypothetical protein